MTWLVWLSALLLWAVTAFLQHRLCAFRVDRPWHRAYFGPVIESLSGLEWMRRENYTSAGQRLYAWTIGAWLAAMAAFLLAGLATLVRT